MVRRAAVYEPVTGTYDESHVVVRPSVASVVANVVTGTYVTILSVLGLDTLLRALGARRSNGLVSFVHALIRPLTAPFQGVFAHQQYWATALIASVVFTIGYVIVMAALGRDRTY